MTMTIRLSGVEYGATPRGMSSGLVRPARWVVLHATDNTASARAEAHYAATRTDDRSRWTSAHFYVDSGEIVGSVPLDMKAWAAYSEANGHGWHIEMCGLSDRVPAAVIERTAGLVARLCELDKVPVRHCTPSMVAALQRGITGHADITKGLNVGSHTDPGPHFDWSQFLAMVEEGDMPTAKEIAEAVWAYQMKQVLDDRVQPASTYLRYNNKQVYANGASLAALRADVAAALGRDPVDEEQIVQGVLSGLGGKDPQTIAAALLAVMSPEQARAVGALLAQS